MRKSKGTKRKVRFLDFVQTGESMTLVNCGKSCVYNVMPRAIIKYLYKDTH